MKWTDHLEGGPMRVNHAAVRVGDKIYSVGGYNSTNDYKDLDPISMHILDPATLSWTQLSYTQDVVLIPFQRFGHSAVAYKEKIYIWGGRNNLIPCHRLACFDINTFEWTHPKVCGLVPTAKDGHSACLIQNRMYVFGGLRIDNDQFSNELYYLNMDTMEWHFIKAEGVYPSHRDFHTAVAYGDKMYIFGGRGDKYSPFHSSKEKYCIKVFILETVGTHRWIQVNRRGPWPVPRRSHSAWVYEDFMYIFGGYNGLLRIHFNDVWRYSFKDNLWRNCSLQGEKPSKRRRQQCIMYGSKMFLFGGTSPSTCPDAVTPTTPTSEALVESSDMHVMDCWPSLKTLVISRILELGLDTSMLPWIIKIDIQAMEASTTYVSRRDNPTG